MLISFRIAFRFNFVMLVSQAMTFALAAQEIDIRHADPDIGLQTKADNNLKQLNETDRSFLLPAFDYSSNTNTLGNFNQFVRQPSSNLSISYFSKYEFDIGLSGIITANSDDSLQSSTTEIDFYAGYSIGLFNKKLTIYPSYMHFIYSRNSGTLKSLFSDNFQLDIMYMSNRITSGNSSNYLTGPERTFMTTFYFSLNFVKENLFFKNTSLSFLPEADLNLGNYSYLNNYYLDYFREHPLQLLTLREIVIMRRQNLDMTTNELIDYLLETKTDDHFKATSFGLIFPLYYMVDNLSFNLSGIIYFPIGMPDYLDSSVQFYFSAGVSYEIGL